MITLISEYGNEVVYTDDADKIERLLALNFRIKEEKPITAPTTVNKEESNGEKKTAEKINKPQAKRTPAQNTTKSRCKKNEPKG